jgi:hypothetical protein
VSTKIRPEAVTRAEGFEVWLYGGTRVLWSDADLGARTPRRTNGLRSSFEPPSPSDVWARVRTTIRVDTWHEPTIERNFGDGAFAQLAAARASDAPPEDIEVLGVLARLVPGVAELALAVGGVRLAFQTMRRYTEHAQPFTSCRPLVSDVVRSSVLAMTDAEATRAAAIAREVSAGARAEALVAIADAVDFDGELTHAAVLATVATPLATVPPRLAATVDDPALLLRVLRQWTKPALQELADVAFDVLANLGPSAAAPLGMALRARASDGTPAVARLAAALACIETAEAGTFIVPLLGSKKLAPIARAWCERMGARATPALEAMARGELVDRKGAGNTGIAAARALLGTSSTVPAAAVTQSTPASASADETDPSMPDVLARPPWMTREKKKLLALSLALLPFDDAVPAHVPTAPRQHRDPGYLERCRGELARARSGGQQMYVSALEFLPDAEALEAWNVCEAAWFHGGDYDAREIETLLRRFGVAAIDGLLRYARDKLPSAVPAMQLVISPRIAPLMALVFAKGKKRDAAEAWLLEHPEVAAIGLVPAALGKERALRDAAAVALRFLAGSDLRATVRDVAGRYGDAAREAVDAVLRDDLPARLPSDATFVSASELPKLRLVNGHELPAAAVDNLVTMLRFTPIVPPYSGIADVRDACDRASLREIAWAIFDRWRTRGCDTRDEWALWAVGHLGDDELVPKLVDLLGSWQSTGAAARAARALDAIALIGTDLAFLHLDRVARKSRYPLLRGAARDAVGRVARRLRISADELEDRRAPDLGLDDDGCLRFDLGKGKIIKATLDEQLRPLLIDADGGRLAKLPKRDTDADAFEAASKRYKELTKEAKLVAESQIARFERAMITERTWSVESFRTYILGHPVLGHLARRLVWSVEHGDDRATFRVAEDRTLADHGDGAFTLPTTTNAVRIVHPVRLDEAARHRWAELFAEYEVLQPFRQLDRPLNALASGDDKEGTRLTSFEGRVVGWDRIAALLRAGFRDASADSQIHTVAFALPSGPSVRVSMQPGLRRGDPRDSGAQTLSSVHVAGVKRIADLGPVATSELLLALTPLDERRI